MAGDPYQLGPITRSPIAHKYGLSKSLLERLMESSPYTDQETGKYDNRCVMKLVRNFRLINQITLFSMLKIFL